MGGRGFGLEPEMVRGVAAELEEVVGLGVELAIVIGGGNIIRGLAAAEHGIERVTGDYMGMLATVINALALQDALEKRGVDTRVQTAIDIRDVAEPFIRRRADPEKDPDAELLRSVTYQQVLGRDLRFMDAAAISLCRDNDIPIVLFDLRETGNIRRVLLGAEVGSLVHG